jgi:hypothetical protein
MSLPANEPTTPKRQSSLPPFLFLILKSSNLTSHTKDDVLEDTRPLAERATKTSHKSAGAFKNDDASTLVEGKGKRDVNGKLMTKREIAAEGALRVVIYSCVVM